MDLVIRFGGWIWWRGGWIAGLDDGFGSPDGAPCWMVCGFGVGVLEGGFVLMILRLFHKTAYLSLLSLIRQLAQTPSNVVTILLRTQKYEFDSC